MSERSAISAFSLPPEQAIRFFRQKTNIPTRSWDDLRHGAHARAWSVAGVTSNDILADMRTAMDRGNAEGTTFDQFREDIGPLLGRLGWADRGPGYVAWRTRIVYETNMRTAYAAGRYAEMTDPDVLAARPFWRYRHSGKKHFRPQHKDWDGLVLRAEDAFWHTHYPPNGWGCGCFVQSLGPRDLARDPARKGKDGPDEAPLTGAVPRRDPRTGEIHTVPPGIDPGWDYNVGRSWLHGTVPPQLAEPLAPYSGTGRGPTGQLPADLPAMPPPRPAVTAELLPADQPEEFYVHRFLQEFGATRERPAVFRDVSGTRLVIGPELFIRAGQFTKADAVARGRFMLRLAEALKEPDEIWLDWAQTADGGAHVRRRYLRRFADDRRGALTVFEWTPAGWFGTTVFVARNASYIERQRSGVLLYRIAEAQAENE